MTDFAPGDRIRIRSVGDDGLPLIRYGFFGSRCLENGTITVMLDDDVSTQTITDISQVESVSVTSVELELHGVDLLTEPTLRQGLAHLWRAEAEHAGLEIDAIHLIGNGLRDSSDGYVLAELTTGAQHYVLRAVCEPNQPDIVMVRAERPNRWDF
jgi:hypothetical protein